MEINSEIHKLITRADAYSLKPTTDDKPKPVKFIDYENLDNNEFLIVNQMKFKGERANSIPDLVVFVNGLPLAVIEANEEINRALALELLEKKLIDSKLDRKQAVIDFFSDMEEIINRHKNRYSNHGLNNEKQLVVYDLIKELTDQGTESLHLIYLRHHSQKIDGVVVAQ